MITELTQEQKDLFPVYVDKWIGIGLDTSRADRPKAEQNIKNIYKFCQFEEPIVHWLPCPISGYIAVYIFSTFLKDKKAFSSKQFDKLFNTLVSKNNIADDVANNIIGKVHDVVEKALSQVDMAQVSDKISVEDNVRAYFGGSLWAGFPAWADYFNQVCKVEIDTNHIELTKNCGYYWTLNGFAFLTERPLEIHLKEKRLHCETGMAIRYESGWGLYSLSGVVVPKELVTTPADKLDVNLIVTEKNAEVRKEIARKIGWKRIIAELKVEVLEEMNGVDLYLKYPIENYYQQGDQVVWRETKKEVKFSELRDDFAKRLAEITYKLVNLDLGEKRMRPFLVMTNATHTKDEHIEPVEPNCSSIFEAICFRNGEKSLPYFLS